MNQIPLTDLLYMRVANKVGVKWVVGDRFATSFGKRRGYTVLIGNDLLLQTFCLNTLDDTFNRISNKEQNKQRQDEGNGYLSHVGLGGQRYAVRRRHYHGVGCRGDDFRYRAIVDTHVRIGRKGLE